MFGYLNNLQMIYNLQRLLPKIHSVSLTFFNGQKNPIVTNSKRFDPTITAIVSDLYVQCIFKYNHHFDRVF